MLHDEFAEILLILFLVLCKNKQYDILVK